MHACTQTQVNKAEKAADLSRWRAMVHKDGKDVNEEDLFACLDENDSRE